MKFLKEHSRCLRYLTYFSHVTKAKKTKGEVITSQKNEGRTKRAEVASQGPPLLRWGTRKHLCYVYRVSMTREHLRLLKIVFLMNEERFLKFSTFLLHGFHLLLGMFREYGESSIALLSIDFYAACILKWARATYVPVNKNKTLRTWLTDAYCPSYCFSVRYRCVARSISSMSAFKLYSKKKIMLSTPGYKMFVKLNTVLLFVIYRVA